MMPPRYEEMLLPERRARLEAVLDGRTRNLTLVLESIYDPHNAAACLRSAEGFGLQDIHIIEGPTSFSPQARVVQGADKWLDLHRHRSTPACLAALRAEGFQVWVSDLNATTTLDAIDLSQPTALAFGNEHDGASPELIDNADGTFIIPMSGFTQSFNISVAVAVALHDAVSRRRAMTGSSGDLTAEQRDALWRRWVRLSVKRGDEIAAAFESERRFDNDR